MRQGGRIHFDILNAMFGKLLLSGICLFVLINIIERDFSSTIPNVVSANPALKDIIHENDNMITDEDDEILVRVKRSPDPNSQPRGGRGGGSRGGSRFRGGSRYRGGGSGRGGGGGNLSTGAIIGIVFGVIGGSALIFAIIYFCAKQ